MKNILYLVILMISQIETRQISKYCVCRHAESMDNCQKSQICIWKDGRCDLRQGETYIKQDLQNQENQCNRYAQEDCIEMEMCGFYLGECIRFTECSLFQKNQCQESSLKCVSDGQKCIEKKECTDYETEIGCQNRNKNGNYCFWDINQQPKCQNVSKCIQLPKYLKSDLDCRNEYLNCTVNEEGFGCEEERQKCEEYTVENQCYFTQNKNIECFWDVELQKCFEKNCENKRLTTYDECNSYMEKCSTNGIHCIEKKECIDIKNGIGCVQDKNNNKCVYQNGNCQIKSCKTAPLQYNNYEQCQQYDQKLDCVSAQNGGCKNRPTQCIDYQSEIECYSWKIQDCIWYENKCAKRQCFHAPKSYNNSDCRLLGKCMGTINGGCQLRPETCQEILTQEFCEITYDESLCIWEQNQCKQLICSNLKLPKYDSHQKCQEASKYCTFSIETGGCLDYLCSKVVDITACTIDSQGQLCQINDGCILKICKRAPSYYNTNQQCESWISKCTVKIYQFDGFNLSFGCIDKPNECSIATQEQCYSTFSGNKCKWESQSKKCVSQQCIDADNSHTINDKCINYKVENQSCFINNTNNGCIDWPSSCSEMVTQIQCQIGLKNNQAQCVWSIDKCRSINCSDAQNTLYTNNIQCSKYQKDCIVNSTLEGCITRPTNLICSSSPKNDMYDTHQECQAWNPNCTIPDPLANLGCQLKSNSCSDYTSEAQCKIIYDPQYPYVNSKSYCFWDYFTSTCQSGFQDPDYQCNRRIIGELTHTDCENFMKICTINKITATCIPLQNECTNYTIQQSCVINHYQQPCYWDRFQSKCLNLSCYENTTALTELTCSQYKRQNLCQLIHNEQGIPQMGCEDRPSNCSQISHQQICNKTITTLNQKCYYYNKKCNTLTNEDQCQFINFATTDQECQYYHQFCLLQQSGVGCYSANKCSSLVRTNCQSSYLQFNNKCLYYNNTCRSNLFCADLFTTSSSCDNVKTSLNILCSFEYIDNSLKCVPKQCVLNNLSGSLIEKQTQCQNFSSICTYDMSSDSTLRSCKEILNCSDLDVQGSINYKLCNQSLTASFQKCGFNFDSNICQDRQCEHLKFTNYGPLSDEQCYNWNYNCVFDGINCKTFDNIDCTQIKLKYQCLQYSQCKLQQNDCVKNINCELNTTSTSIYECQLIHSICSLNYIVGHGCKLSKCENISNPTYCDFTRTGDGMECYWNTSSCIPKSCNLFLTSSSCESSYGVLIIDTQITTVKCYWCNSCSYNNICNKPINQVTHEDCQKENIFTTISFTDTTKCILKKNNCEDYTFKESCVTTINDVKCAWTGSCKDFCQSIATVPTSNQNCYTFDKHCMIGTGTCVQLDCSKLTAVDCVIYEKICTINSLNVCIKITDCSSFSTTSACNLGQDQYGYNCIDNGGTCQRVSVTEDCSSLGSLDNHEQCEQFFRSGKCTVKSKNLNCIDLPNQCGNNISEQLCLIDKDSKRCYWNNVMNSCIQLVNCSDLGTENDSHEKCNSYMQDCTVNQLKNGCIEIDECFMYSIKEQCRIEKGNKECEWVSQQNLCKKKSCETAQLKKYTAGGCQMYYDQKCTVNSDFTQCEQAQGQCQGYQEQQCKSEGQLNLEGTECFWNKEQNQCVEKTCENGPKFALSDLECQGYMQSCQKGGCRLRICSDYFYAVDSACSEIFPNKKCATNGYQCVDRGTCEDALIRDGCTFDINLNDCVWIQKKCILKTCNTAEKSLSTHKECQDYLQKCTSKKDGGCIQIDECYLMQIEEGCKSDKYNQGCVWDDYLGLCLTDICEGYCGDGIITNHLEICDDGNFVPYDGCYKCQIQCSLGCLECEGKICKICDSYGWRLLNTQCQSICGDGIIVGKEYCDDGNQVEFDGCYNCEYSQMFLRNVYRVSLWIISK
ncbi:unnamed protein product [Paramecium sonneborni]|uniref:Uncharacterized protein n=1 Tax=Paramecium sonneborni TaxID=65129 RepID=A0A8S1QWL8_9CILI|nr:unnamed protein product [Paramecium sonneborni]